MRSGTAAGTREHLLQVWNTLLSGQLTHPIRMSQNILLITTSCLYGKILPAAAQLVRPQLIPWRPFWVARGVTRPDEAGSVAVFSWCCEHDVTPWKPRKANRRFVPRDWNNTQPTSVTSQWNAAPPKRTFWRLFVFPGELGNICARPFVCLPPSQTGPALNG